MRRFSKWMGGLAGGLLSFGLVFALVGWALGGQTSMDVTVAGQPVTVGIGGFYTHSNTWKGEKSTIVEDDLAPFNRLDIDISLGDVDIIPSDHFGVEMSWHGKNYELHYENENGTLKVWSTSIPTIGIHLGVNFGGEVNVYLPEGLGMSDVTVKDNLGDVNLTGFHADELDVTANLGNVTIQNVTTGEGIMNLDLGDLDLDSVTADKLDMTLSLGKLTAYGLSTTKELTVKNSLGDINIAGSLAGNTEIIADLGGVSLSTNLPERDYGYELKTDLGSVHVNGEKSKDEARRSGGEHMITVYNDLGDIDLDFQ